jgi:hypothetical protein
MDLNNIDTNLIKVRPPRRYDESFVCKVDYGDEKKFVVAFTSTECLFFSERSSTIVIKPPSPKSACKKIVSYENAIIDQVRAKATDWFGDKIKSDSFDANFHSSAIIHPTAGNAIKMRFIGDIVCDEGKTYNMKIQLHGIKFKKNSFTLMWKVLEAKEFEPLFLDDDDEPDQDLEAEAESVIDTIALRAHLKDQLEDMMNTVCKELVAAREHVKVLQERLAKVEKYQEFLEKATETDQLLRLGDELHL